MDQVKDWLNTPGVGNGQILENVVITIAAFLVARWIGGHLRKITISALRSRSFAINEATLLGRLVSMAAYGVAIIVTLIAWGMNSTGLLATLGIFTVAVGISLQDVFRNFFSGVLLLLEKPFVVGDYMHIKHVEGEVLGIDTRATRLRAPNGTTVTVPNFYLYSQISTIQSIRGTRRIELQVTGNGVSAPGLVKMVQKAVLDTGMVKQPSVQPNTLSTSSEKSVVRLSVLLAEGPEVREQFIAAIMEQSSDTSLEVLVL